MTSDDFFADLKNKVAVVTGGASGIGKAIAETLSRYGATVVISDINEAQGQALANALNGHFVPANLQNEEHCKRVVEETIQQAGALDILVNNAGLQHVAPIETFPEDKWAAMIQIMLVAPFILTKHAWPFMKAKRWGRIVNMGSIHSKVASLNKSAYISAKHGLLGLTKSAALEGGEHGITANAVCPAYVRTPLVENQIDDQARNLKIDRQDVEQQVLLKSAAVKRLIEPQEVADLVCYLCSDKAGAITGAAWDVDLGWTAQ